jgi:Small primase-like proteins (Toprim domain)
MKDDERLAAIVEVLQDLSDLAEDHILLVEGLRDKSALEALGIEGRFFMIQSEGGPIKAAEFASQNGNKAVILTDWDWRGGRIASDVSRHLSALGVEFDLAIRSKLSSLCKKYVTDVESLDSLVERLTVNASGIKGMI